VAGPAKVRRDSGSLSLADAPQPPHSIEAEQAVLGGLLLDPRPGITSADVVIPEDFYRPDHRLIFQAIGELAGNAKPCDVVTVVGELERRSELDQAGGLAYLGSLARDTPTAANVRAYADIVRERSLLRQLITAGTEIASAVSTTTARPRASWSIRPSRKSSKSRRWVPAASRAQWRSARCFRL